MTKIGFNPQDRFMVALNSFGPSLLLVITQEGNVFGTELSGSSLEPVFQFGGSKIGFNPQDRFMLMTDASTLAVITQEGNVFGTNVNLAVPELGPVFQFGGSKIGFNPQDRFMVAINRFGADGSNIGGTLAVITQEGKVFGTDVDKESRTLGPVFQFEGPKIGFNPQDRFMVAIGGTLAVITQEGNVFGTDVDVQRRTLGPVFQFGGPKIGFNPEDKFMVEIDLGFTNTHELAVITQDGSVFTSSVFQGTLGSIEPRK
jgi:hypothetical protein